MHRARKRFGQHFLHDTAVIRRIVDAIDPQPGQPLVEIGPGLGALTYPVLERCKQLRAVEIDRDVIAQLRIQAPRHGELEIHEADVLNFDLSALHEPGTPPLRLIGNLPYNISTPLLFHLLAQREHIADMHFMLQKEVVDRMAAQPDSSDYGRLTVMLAPWLEVESLFDIGPGAFRPPPKVMSSIVRLRPLAVPRFAIPNQDNFARVVAAAFSQRRKTLRNALRGLLDAEQIAAAGIDPSVRGEVLSPASFAVLAAQL